MYSRILFTLALLTFFLPPSLLWAEETIYLKGKEKPIKTAITKESGLGVQGAGGLIPAEDIVDIEYELKTTDVTLQINYVRKARGLEKEAQDKETGRKVNLANAIQLYEDVIAKMSANQPLARRNFEFRVAALRSRQAIEFDSFVEPAVEKLNSFKTTHPDSWQISQVYRLLANVYLAQKKYAQAEKTYLELTKAPVSEDTKNEAEYLAAQVNVQANNYDQALKSLRALANRLPKDNRFGMKARVAEAECLAVANKHDEANKVLKQILKEATDKNLKAMAYNTLGKNLYKQGQLKEARWEFLWVDVVYNQDKAEHAKALYFLSLIFEKLGEPDRAQECRELLRTDPAFAGLEYQRMALADTKN
jgi:tetratricopeptide (TPR) repeat protein